MPDQVLHFRAEGHGADTSRIVPEEISSDAGLLLASVTSFRAALMSAPTPYLVFTKEGETVLVNESFVRVTGYGLSDLPDIRACLTKMRRLPAAEIEAVHAGWAHSQTRASSKEMTVWTARDERLVWRIQTSDPMIWPDGRHVIFQSMFDLTEQRRLEEEFRRNQEDMASANIALRRTLDLLFLSLRAAGVSVFTQDHDLRYIWIGGDYFGCDPEASLGAQDSDVVPDELVEPLLEMKRKVFETGQAAHQDLPYQKEGKTFWCNVQIEPWRSHNGDVQSLLGAVSDISESKATEQHIRTLLAELAHRSKNLLTVIQVMARRSVSPDLSSSDFVDSFIERLSGLAQSHDLLAREDWRGISMRELVTSQIGHLNSDLSSRLYTNGPDLVLTPVAAQNLGMAVHELSTNAVKYGALSVDGGEVHISWSVFEDDHGRDRLRLSWLERGGPKVVEPTRRGFGRFVIEAIAARVLSGSVDLRFDPEGVSCAIEGAADSTVIAQKQVVTEAPLS